jgi:hypothetical protein
MQPIELQLLKHLKFRNYYFSSDDYDAYDSCHFTELQMQLEDLDPIHKFGIHSQVQIHKTQATSWPSGQGA